MPPPDRPFDRAGLDAATAVVRRHMPPTPTHAWPLLAELTGAQVVVKHENHTPTGAFKVRGGLVLADELVRGGFGGALVTATRGNHGQSLAFAGRAYGLRGTIVGPKGYDPVQNAAMTGFGATVVVAGRDFQAAREHAAELAQRSGARAVPPFHPALVRGVATYALELFEVVRQPLDAVFVPIGMGSGSCGLIAVRDLLGLRTRIVGVVSAGAPAYALSLAAGHVVGTERADTIADGVATRSPDPDAFAALRAGVHEIVQVDDDAVRSAMRQLYRCTHQVAEGAGAIGLAGLMSRRAEYAGAQVGVVLSGANISAARLVEVLGAADAEPDPSDAATSPG